MKLLKNSLLALILLTQNAFADEQSEKQLINFVNKIKSYQCHFVQYIDDPDGGAVSKMEGELSVLRPGRFLWKTNPPDSILVVADGQNLWTYDIELEQVTQQELKKALASSPAAVLIGSPGQILDDFNIEKISTDNCSQDKTQCFDLKPKNEGEMFNKIHLKFSGEKLVEVSMEDPLGQHVLTKFSNISVNVALNEKIFKFTPPKDVDVIKPGS